MPGRWKFLLGRPIFGDYVKFQECIGETKSKHLNICPSLCAPHTRREGVWKRQIFPKQIHLKKTRSHRSGSDWNIISNVLFIAFCPLSFYYSIWSDVMGILRSWCKCVGRYNKGRCACRMQNITIYICIYHISIRVLSKHCNGEEWRLAKVP